MTEKEKILKLEINKVMISRFGRIEYTPHTKSHFTQFFSFLGRYSKAPLFITKPRSSEAVEGDTVIIDCEVIGDPKPEVFWLRDFLKVRMFFFS